MDASRRKVFVSYSYDSPEHERAVRELVRDMERAGIECLYDQNGEHGMRWAQWMDQQIDDADHVLVICSRMYRDRLRKMAPSGVQFEGGLIIQRLYSGGGINHKFIPVLLKAEDREYIPSAFAGYNYFDLSRPGRREELFRRVGSNRQRGGWRPEVDVAKGVVLYPDGQEAPFMAPADVEGELIGRGALLDTLVGTLTADAATRRRILLWGCAGSGKTAVVTKLAHHADVLEQYSDGVLWVSLGRTMNREMAVAQWASALGVVPGRDRAPDAGDLRRVLAVRRMLLVVDNAYLVDDVNYFYSLIAPDSASALIVTSQFDPNRLKPAEGTVDDHPVPPLPPDQAAALLKQICPTLESAPRLKAVVRRSGGLPLALELLGSYIRAECGASTRSLDGAIDAVCRQAPPPRPRRSDRHAAKLPADLLACINLCYTAVGREAQECLLRLTVLPGRPNTFSLAAARRIAAPPDDNLAPLEMLEELLEYGLMESAGPGRYSIHSTIREYVREYRRRDGVPQQATDLMIRYFALFARDYATCYRRLRPETRNLLQMLMESAKQKQHRHPLLRSLEALSGFFETQGLYWLPEVRGYLHGLNGRAKTGAQKMDVAIELSRRDEKLGRYQIAQARLKPFVKAPPASSASRVSDLHYTLGVVQFNLCDYEAAAESLTRAYIAAARVPHRERMCRALERICLISMYKGDQENAERSAAKARALARGRMQRSPLARALLRLACGRIALIQEKYARAARYARRGLDDAKAEAVGPEVEAALLQVQARAALADSSDHARCREAIYLLRRAIELAQRIGHRWYLSYLQYELGKVHLREGDFERATSAFADGITVARDLQSRDLEAFGLLGMAGLATKRFMPVLAARRAERSLKIFDDIQHFKAIKVRQLLADVQLEVAHRYASEGELELAGVWFQRVILTTTGADRAGDARVREIVTNDKKLRAAQVAAEAGYNAVSQRAEREREARQSAEAKRARRQQRRRRLFDGGNGNGSPIAGSTHQTLMRPGAPANAGDGSQPAHATATTVARRAASPSAASSSSSSRRRRRTGTGRRAGRGSLRGGTGR